MEAWMTARTRARLPFIKPALAVMDTSIAKVPPKQVDRHYHTPEHRVWSAAVIKRAGGVCQGPGCGRSEVRLFADHIVELQDGGAPFDPANGQALCGSCHSRKTAQERRRRQAEPYRHPRPSCA
jgi:5-methylcytosine-specific restriction enzyme A